MDRASAPSREVVDAVAFLLQQPDAPDFRRRAQKLVKRLPAKAQGPAQLDYTESDLFVVSAARKRRADLAVDAAELRAEGRVESPFKAKTKRK